jgi:DNA-binding transcriptional LysR family regulator
MELLQLEMFVAVYEERSFKRGAERVCRTQPAVSLAIAKLEKELGSPLLERRRGRREELHLTRAGELIYRYASRMIGVREELHSALVPGRRRSPERFRLGISEGWCPEWLGEFVGSFRRQRLHVRVEVWYEPMDALFQDVRERKIDMAIVDIPPRFLHGSMETVCVRASLDRGVQSRSQMAWLLRNRAGRSIASLEFEQEIRSFIETQGERAAP